MRLGRTFIIILVVLLLALLGVLAYMNMGSRNNDAAAQATVEGVAQQPQVNTVDVLFLTRPLSRGDVVTADALGTIPYPADLIYIGVYTADQEEDVIGMKAKYGLEQGMYLTNRMISDELMGSEKSLEIGAGKVAVPIPITRFTSLGYALEPGDHVDVIASMLFVDLDPSFQTALPNQGGVVLSPSPNFILPSGVTDQYGQSTSYAVAGSTADVTQNPMENLVAQIVSLGGGSMIGRAEYDAALQQPMYVLPGEPSPRPRLLSQMTVQNAMVLHVGNSDPNQDNAVYVDPKLPTSAEEGQEPQPAKLVNVPDVVTLVVSPQEAIVLNYLVYAEANIMLALRSPYDNEAAPVYTDAVTLDYLMNIYNIPVPNKLDYGLETRVDELAEPVLDNDQNVVILQ